MAKFVLSQDNKTQLVDRIKKALGRPNPTVAVEREYFLGITPKKEITQDKIKGITANDKGIIITLQKAGQLVIQFSEHQDDHAFTLYPKMIRFFANQGTYKLTVK
ncbi:TPA: hypothetical protein DIU27_03990 [Candidatus Collierbacteria bacterium]|uniref:Uncharacterized protein n=1 Tax=Candidatus Collierbacteria bacterium GW2011_GWB2_44_22 TaxID=1618387 RepID=A0A0G1KVB3_9BACT|nr:MAG: hypothetical protein UW31_C0003G0044 [Candidatus Collierbacteria bacterium GW2011_GWA2_44_13]KKT51844.1 MAG: hypothetical protein UW44_C0007G0019 [Candidatus Collierbacteria bacterium GW2011_GWB2_44_22]KKT61703.1 MAG: hypothetical protein UW56_C0021G0018 [Candidatus Collierbacteria bacterium GW2011_GWD1_44_27]KKT64378.1 MAG: hypothetical protein UW58_C0047G0006 [Candidatus Collierbacteria bacterium GW2011_GWC2_44_30]KKT68655.1 MAG: hypothetical protein UW64_C0013G0005 [Microgenomates gr